MTLRVGCSGFLYDHWRGRFYPPSARGTELEVYAQAFDTVELNVTFYRMPSATTFRSWATRVPDDFVFAVKASRYLTHVLRLRGARDAVDHLVERSRELGPHLGPILLQLPPDLPLDLHGLAETLDAFPIGMRVALEVRHPSWFVEAVRDELSARNVPLCLADRRGPLTPTWRTADWAYLRFHAGRGSPAGCYGASALQDWAERTRECWGEDAEGFAYFNNDANGCALVDARRFAQALVACGLDPGRIPTVDDAVIRRPAARSRRG